MSNDAEQLFISPGDASRDADVAAKIAALAKAATGTYDTLDPFRRAVHKYAKVKLGKSEEDAEKFADGIAERVAENLRARGHDITAKLDHFKQFELVKQKRGTTFSDHVAFVTLTQEQAQAWVSRRNAQLTASDVANGWEYAARTPSR